jgi:segregation and condensation protein B
MTLEAKIEAVLFWKGDPISVKKLAEIFSIEKVEVESALKNLETNLKDRGITLQRNDYEVQLGTSPQVSTIIETLTKEELVRDLGKAGLETLSIIIYRGPISRSEIDYIRGVNSSFIVRNLLVRGLIERVENKNDARSFLYKPTFELLSYIGVNTISDLPEFESVRAEIEAFNKKDEPSSPAQSQETESAKTEL